jgi:hypothetical protein
MPNPANRIVKKMGGAIALAQDLGLSDVQVRRWGYPKNKGGCDGLIPSIHMSAILQLAMARDIDLCVSEFFSSVKRVGGNHD